MPLIHQQDDMIEQLELDLADKAAAAFTAANVDSSVFGVFSLDDLETKTENELQRRIAVGVAYSSAAPPEIDSNPKGSAAPGQGMAARMVAYEFLVVLAVPTGPDCMERYNGTKLLSVLRRKIHGASIAVDAASRRWNFQREKPNPEASTETMLYYTQVWQVALPLVGSA